jgi:glycosyltransferase involved in cell wall biosynthesis
MSQNTTKPLVIDTQLLQTTAWNRGMGHYCKSLLTAFAKKYGSDNITLIFNKNLALEQDRRTILKKILPEASIVELDLPTLTGDIKGGQAAARRALDAYIDESFSEKVDFLLLQLFTYDYCAAFPTHANKLLLCFDFIPLLHWDDFSRYFGAHMYFPHFSTIFEADILLAISETTKHQLEDCFAIESERIVNINGAYIEREVKPGQTFNLPEKPYILFVTADLPHKNNQVAVDAFRRFNQELADRFTLVFTSTISEKTQKLMRSYTDKVVFTGNISDDELEALYKGAYATMLISRVEGLGLPILEAVEHNKPVVCSTIDVFKEISKDAFYYCDPHDVDSVAFALRQAIRGVDWERKFKQYDAIRQEYTWEHSAEGLEDAIQRAEKQKPVKASGKLAVVYPHPSTTSGELGLYVQSLLPALQREKHVTAYASADDYVDETRKPYFARFVFSTGLAEEYEAHAATRAGKALYFIDDTTASTEVLRAALLRPGYCVLTTKRVDKLLAAMVARGYVSAELVDVLPAEGRSDALVTILEQTGNVVMLLDTQNNTLKQAKATANSEVRSPAGGRYELAQVISEYIA